MWGHDLDEDAIARAIHPAADPTTAEPRLGSLPCGCFGCGLRSRAAPGLPRRMRNGLLELLDWLCAPARPLTGFERFGDDTRRHATEGAS